MIAPLQSSNRILRPANLGFILLSFVLALLLNLLPFAHWTFTPDWLALVLVFWAVHQPQRIGLGLAFILGLVMDVANGGVMGQHPLAYVLITYLAAELSKRILWFRLFYQTLQVFPLLLLGQVAMLCARLIAGSSFPGWTYFLPSVVGALLWTPLTFALLLPQFRPTDRDENRPI